MCVIFTTLVISMISAAIIGLVEFTREICTALDPSPPRVKRRGVGIRNIAIKHYYHTRLTRSDVRINAAYGINCVRNHVVIFSIT